MDAAREAEEHYAALAEQAAYEDAIAERDAAEFVAGWWNVAEDDYHASDLVSRGKLEVLRRSPQEFHGRYITRTITMVVTKPLRVGRLLHVGALQPERWEAEFTLAPPDDIGPPEPPKPVPAEGKTAQSKEHKENLAAWRIEHEQWECAVAAERDALIRGREIVKPDEWDTVIACTHAIAGHPLASSLLSGPGVITERSIRWEDPDTGIRMRARLDAVNEETDVVADLKSLGGTPTPDAFRREVVSHWYYGQDAIYSDGYEAVTGRRPRFPFVVVNKGAPNEVAVYELGAAEVTLGRREYKAALVELAWRLERDEWLAPWSAKPQVITFDSWTFRNSEEWASHG
jgi:hypothetical protein